MGGFFSTQIEGLAQPRNGKGLSKPKAANGNGKSGGALSKYLSMTIRKGETHEQFSKRVETEAARDSAAKKGSQYPHAAVRYMHRD